MQRPRERRARHAFAEQRRELIEAPARVLEPVVDAAAAAAERRAARVCCARAERIGCALAIFEVARALIVARRRRGPNT